MREQRHRGDDEADFEQRLSQIEAYSALFSLLDALFEDFSRFTYLLSGHQTHLILDLRIRGNLDLFRANLYLRL